MTPIPPQTPAGKPEPRTRLIRASTDLLAVFGTRTDDGRRITAEWGEPDADGIYEPTFTTTDDGWPREVLRRALINWKRQDQPEKPLAVVRRWADWLLDEPAIEDQAATEARRELLAKVEGLPLWGRSTDTKLAQVVSRAAVLRLIEEDDGRGYIHAAVHQASYVQGARDVYQAATEARRELDVDVLVKAIESLAHGRCCWDAAVDAPDLAAEYRRLIEESHD